jgi:pyruvate formate lyase activating enzyme
VAGWIARHLGDETPWHLERFSPKYKLADLPQTPVATLERARELGRTKGLRYVYISNVAPHEGNHTLCPRCGNALIKRLGFKVLSNTLKDGRCPRCQTPVPGLWK